MSSKKGGGTYPCRSQVMLSSPPTADNATLPVLIKPCKPKPGWSIPVPKKVTVYFDGQAFEATIEKMPTIGPHGGQLDLVLSSTTEWPGPGEISFWHRLQLANHQVDGSPPRFQCNICRKTFAMATSPPGPWPEPSIAYDCPEHFADGVGERGEPISWRRPKEARFIVPCHMEGCLPPVTSLTKFIQKGSTE